MNVRSWQLQRFSLTLKSPLKTASREFHVREGVVLMLQASSFAGFGESTPLESFGTESIERSVPAIAEACEWLMGREMADEPSSLDAWLDECEPLWACPSARNAVETALLDLLSRERRLPLRRFLHPDARDQLEVNAILPPQLPLALAEAGRKAVDEGFSTVKVKVAALSFEEDLRRIEALRRAVGDQVRIRIDANGGWDHLVAAQRLQGLGAFGLELCEQPVGVTQLMALEPLPGKVPCRIAADEAVASIHSARELVSCEPRRADVLVLRPAVLGGLLRTVRVGWEAWARGIGSYVASSLDGPIARAASAHAAAALPDCDLACGLATGALYENEPPSALAPSHGRISFGESPGLGLTPRPP